MGSHRPGWRQAGRLVTAITVVTVLAGLSACTGGAQKPGQTSVAPSVKRLTVAAYPELLTLDPTAQAPVASAQAQLHNVYETLVKIDTQGKIQPQLAQRWDVSKDGLTYTFRINPAATFASGKKVTADAVAKNIERVRTGLLNGQPIKAPDGSDVKVGSKYTSWMKVVASTKAIDESTLEVTLTRPSNSWLYAMGDTPGMIADPDGFATMAVKSAGSGPYIYKEWRKGDSLTLERNTKYWGTPPRFDEVIFKYIADPNAMNTALLAGTVDIIANEQAPDSLGQFSDTSKFSVREGTTNGEVVLSLNNASPALSDVRVRKAIAMAIDKKKILADVQANRGVVLGSMAVPTDPYYEDLSGINAYNPQKAKELLAEAGATNLTLRLRPAEMTYASSSATDVAAMLKEVGINTVLEVQPWQSWVQNVFVKGDYDLTIVSHMEARDLNTYDSTQYPTYYWGYKSPTFSALWLAADQAPAEQYPELMKKATRQLAEDAPSVWLYMMPNLVVSKASITGITPNQTSDSFDVTSIAVG